MFVVYTLIFFACSLIFFVFAWCEKVCAAHATKYTFLQYKRIAAIYMLT